MTDPLLSSRRGGVHTWELNRPQRRNAIDGTMTTALLAAVDAAHADADCRAVVLTAARPAFCAGTDLRELATTTDADVIAAREAKWAALASSFRALEVPIIAAVRGAALGGGLFIACFTDWRIAAGDAVFGAPEVELGFPPPGGIEELIDVVGRPRALELMVTCRRLNAAEAKEIGLVDEVVAPERLEVVAHETAERWASRPVEAVSRLKRYMAQRARLTDLERVSLQQRLFREALDGDTAQQTLSRLRSSSARPSTARS